MKASELMIGDWVFNSHHNNYIQITPYDFFTHSHKNGVQSFEGILIPKPTLGRDLSPIPLTEEILKANGFNDKNELYANDNCFLVYDFANNHLIISYFVSGVNIVYFDMCVMFVHELQHALRLCGLNYLADNYEIID